MKAIGFTGTRKGLALPQAGSLAKLMINLYRAHGPPISFHHGDCKGADYEGAELAHAMELWVVAHPPNNPKMRAYFPSDETAPELSYLDRNDAIVTSSDVLIATPMDDHREVQRSGTWSTVRRARKAGIPIYIIWPDGEVEKENIDA